MTPSSCLRREIAADNNFKHRFNHQGHLCGILAGLFIRYAYYYKNRHVRIVTTSFGAFLCIVAHKRGEIKKSVIPDDWILPPDRKKDWFRIANRPRLIFIGMRKPDSGME